MKVELEELGSCRIRMAVEVPAELVEQEMDSLYRDLQKKVQLKGFRKGKAPRSILARYYSNSVEQDLIKKIVPDSCLQIIREKDLKAVGLPKVDDVKLEEQKSLKYTAVIDVIPPIPLPEYKGMEFSRRITQSSPSQVAKELERLQEVHARVTNVDRSGQVGDYVMIRYLGVLAGEAFQEGEGESTAVVIGSGRFLPEVGFESQLIGLRKGDHKEFSGFFPKDFRDVQIAGKEVVFRVWVEEVKLRELPELDDEFAREVGNYEDLAELKAKLLRELEQRGKRRADGVLKQELLESLVKQNPVPVPDSLVDEEVKRTLGDMEEQLRAQGKSLKDSQVEVDRHTETIRESALSRIRGELILEKISEAEDIRVSDEELEAEIQRLATFARQSPEALRAQMEKGDNLDRLRQQLRFEKTLEFLVDQSNIQEVIIEVLEGETSEGETSAPPRTEE